MRRRRPLAPVLTLKVFRDWLANASSNRLCISVDGAAFDLAANYTSPDRCEFGGKILIVRVLPPDSTSPPEAVGVVVARAVGRTLPGGFVSTTGYTRFVFKKGNLDTVSCALIRAHAC